MVDDEARVVIVMGVSGSGKTTVGKRLAAELGWLFFDADDFHPRGNIEKMAAGEPLTDADRWPWLDRLHTLVVAQLAAGLSAVLACSALKRSYRQQIKQGDERVIFIYLQGSYALILERMERREGHFMGAEMLRSQFEALEEPTAAEALHVSVDGTPEMITAEIRQKLTVSSEGGGMEEVDPFVGVWLLDPSQCDYQLGEPPATGRYEIISTETGYTFEMNWTTQAGETLSASYDGVPDGRRHPIDSPTVDEVSLTWVSEWRLDSASFKKGETVSHAARELSEDGETMRVTQSGKTAEGKPYHNVSVYHKQK